MCAEDLSKSQANAVCQGRNRGRREFYRSRATAVMSAALVGLNASSATAAEFVYKMAAMREASIPSTLGGAMKSL